MAKWRIKRGDKIAGEVPSSKVRQLAAAGKLRKTDLLSKEGTEKWVVAASVKGLWGSKPQSQNEAVSAKAQTKPQTTASPSPGDAAQTDQGPKVGKEALPQQEAPEPAPQPEATEPAPQPKATEPASQPEAPEPAPQQEAPEPTPQPKATEPAPQPEAPEPAPQPEAIETPPHLEAHEPEAPEPAPQQKAPEPTPQPKATEPAPQPEAIETPPHLEAHEPEATEPALQPEASTSRQEAIDEYDAPSIEPLAEPDDEFVEESHPMPDDAEAPPRPKWLVPLIAGGIGSFLLLGLVSVFMSGDNSEVNQRKPHLQQRQPDTTQQRPSRAKSGINLPLTQNFFPPNIEKNYQYTTKKFENNTTVAVYEKTYIEKWDTDSELYFHEKGFRNYGQKVPYRVSNGYVQLKGGENWFRFLKLDAKIGDRWTPGDGEDGTLDWADKGEIELVDYKTIDSVPVAIVEFTAKPELAVPSYLVPVAFDFGSMEDGSGPIEGKLRFELGDGLGMLRADAIVPKGTRHSNGGGRDTSDWIFATRLRNKAAKNGDAASQSANE